MARRLTLVVAGAFAASVLMAGAAQAVCDPHCSPKSNSGGELRGLNRANEAAGQHGQQGRDNAAAKQDLHKPGGSGVNSPLPPVTPPVTPPVIPPVIPPVTPPVEPPVTPPPPPPGA